MADDGMMYLAFPDGSLRGISSTPQDGVRRLIPSGAVEITRDEFSTRAEQARVVISGRREELRAADAGRQREDYLALLTASLPEGLARRLSGYSGEPVSAT